MARRLFEGHVRVEPGMLDDVDAEEYIKHVALKFVRGKDGTNLSSMIFNREECDDGMSDFAFAVYADFKV